VDLSVLNSSYKPEPLQNTNQPYLTDAIEYRRYNSQKLIQNDIKQRRVAAFVDQFNQFIIVKGIRYQFVKLCRDAIKCRLILVEYCDRITLPCFNNGNGIAFQRLCAGTGIAKLCMT